MDEEGMKKVLAKVKQLRAGEPDDSRATVAVEMLKLINDKSWELARLVRCTHHHEESRPLSCRAAHKHAH